MHARTSQRFPAVPIAVAATIAVSVVLTGCSVGANTPASAPAAAELPFQHLHELQIAEDTGSVLVASHEGLYRLDVSPNGDTKMTGPIAGLDFDPMGFTVADGVAYASGHPGPTTPSSFGSPNLGLISSTDLGETWSTISLRGVTDFHGLTVMPEENSAPRIFGLDPSKQNLQRSMDGGQTWNDGSLLSARDILASGQTLYATTPDGLLASADYGTTFAPVADAPELYLIAPDANGALAGVDTAGSIWTTSGDEKWIEGGAATGAVEALAVSGERIYVADDRGISFSDDAGANWVVVTVQG